MGGQVNKFGVGGCCCGPPATTCVCCQADRYGVTVNWAAPVTPVGFIPPAGWNGVCPAPGNWQFRNVTFYAAPSFQLAKCFPSPCVEASGMRTRDRYWRGCSVPFAGTGLWDSTVTPGLTTTSNVDAMLVLRLRCFEEYTFFGGGWTRTDYFMTLASGLHVAIGTCPTDANPALPACSYAGPACYGVWSAGELPLGAPYCGQGFDHFHDSVNAGKPTYHFTPIGVS